MSFIFDKVITETKQFHFFMVHSVVVFFHSKMTRIK